MSRIKIGGDLWTLDTEDPPVSVQKGQSRTNIVLTSRTKIQWNKNWWGTFTSWVVGTPQFKCKKVRVEQKWVEQKLCDPAEQKSVE